MRFFALIKKTCPTNLTIVAITIALLLASIFMPSQAQNLERGKEIATTQCIGCHGADGNSSVSTYPKLAGQHPGYTGKQIRDFKPDKDGKILRNSPIMMGFSTILSDEDIKSISAFYAAQTRSTEVAKNKELKAIAEKLYRGGDSNRAIPPCAGCHGPAGAGIPSQYPAVAGQFADYNKLSLLQYRSGERANDPEAMMRNIAKHLTDNEIEALADYLAGMRLAK